MERPLYDNVFRRWLHSYEGLQCFCVVGGHGVGKSHWIQHICDAIHYRIIWITPDQCMNAKEFLSRLQKNLSGTSVDALFDSFPLNHYAIVIDEWESFNQNDRTTFVHFQQWWMSSPQNPYQRPLICIGHLTMEKRFRELKGATLMTMMPPSESDLCLYLRSRFPHVSLKEISTVAETCDGNLRRALNAITPQQTASVLMSSYRADKPPSLSQLFQLDSPEAAYTLVLQDPWMIPLRFHENALKYLENRKGTKTQKINLYHHYLTHVLHWNTMMTEAMKEEDFIQLSTDSVAHYTGHLIHRFQHHLPPLKKPKHTASLTDFTKVLSQLSLQKKQQTSFYAKYKASHYPIYEYPSHWFAE